MLFYFTGTGNSLYIVQRLAEKLNEPICSMAEGKPDNQLGGKGKSIGFVFPSYYGNLPRIVRDFIDRLDIHPDTYLFGIVTMGGAGTGSITMLEKALADKNLELSYGLGIPMPANYIAKYNPMLFGRTAKAGKKIQKISDDIKARKAFIKRGWLITNTLYQNIEELDTAFYAESHCSGCGLCAQVCPVVNIQMSGNRPEWLHHCEHCMACIHRCPQKAIQYGEKTKKRRRFYNDAVK